MAETKDINEAIRELISDQLQVVTYKWLARHFALPAAKAKQVLSDFADAHRGKLSVTYMLSGYQTAVPPDGGSGNSSSPSGQGKAGRQHVVQLVSGDRLQECQAQLDKDSLHVHVYSIQPAHPKDTADLWNRDQEQLLAAFARLLAAPQDAATDANFGCGGLSAIDCSAARRGNARPPRKPQAPPTPVSIEPLKRSGAAAANTTTGDDGGMSALWRKAPPKDKAKPKAKPKAKTSAKSKAKEPEAEPAQPAAAAPSDGSSSNEEEEDMIAIANTERRKANRAALHSDSSEDEAAPGPAPASAPGRELNGKDSSSQQKRTSPRKARPGSGNTSAQPVGNTNSGSAKRRKVTRSVFNSKGEETIETVWEDAPPSPPAALRAAGDATAATASIAAPAAIEDMPVQPPDDPGSRPPLNPTAANGALARSDSGMAASDKAASSGGSRRGGTAAAVAGNKKTSARGGVTKPKSGSGGGKGSGGAAAKKPASGKGKGKNQPGIASFFAKK